MSGFWITKLEIVWPSFHIRHKYLISNFNRPLVTYLNPYKAWRTRQLLRTNYEALIFFKNARENKFVLLPLAQTNGISGRVHAITAETGLRQ
jgi:hypothetical protein